MQARPDSTSVLRRRPVRALATASLALAVSFGALPALAADDAPPDGASDSATEPTVPTTSTPSAPTTTVPAPASTTTTSTTSTTTSTTSTSTTTTVAPATTAATTTTTNPATSATTTTTTTPATASTTTTTTVPAVSAPEPTARNITVYPEQIQHILATIRYLESRGIYTLPPNKGNASGAYQFIGSTWNNYGGYPHAYLAPPHIQDERAAADVNKFLAQFDNDVSMIPVMWYLPAASRNPALMDVVPLPSAGNVLTIREYQTRWLGVFAFISGQPLESVVAGTANTSQDGSPPIVPIPTDDVPTIAFPVLGPSRVAVPECDDAEGVETADLGGDTASSGPSRADIEAAGLCTEQAPGIVFGVKLQPIMAVADGVVTEVVNERDGETPVSVTITSEAGMSYVYAGFNDDNPGTNDGAAPDHLRLSALAEVGTTVRAGQIIGFMGDSEPLPVGVRADVPTDSTVVLDPDAVAPHIRLSMIDRQGNPVDAFGPVIDALFRQTCSVSIGPWSMPPNGSGHDPVTIETTDDDDSIDSEWIITSTGQVTAAGWAAMVNPSEGCSFTPATAHGPGADGNERGLVHWLEPLDLPTEVWVELALQDGFTAPGGLLRRG